MNQEEKDYEKVMSAGRILMEAEEDYIDMSDKTTEAICFAVYLVLGFSTLIALIVYGVMV